MKLCRFLSESHPWPRVGLLEGTDTLVDLTSAGAPGLTELLERTDVASDVRGWASKPAHRFPLNRVTLLAPAEQQEVWAAGVTYLRSKAARMEESQHSATAYDLVYDADRPELFFKSAGPKASATHGPVGIRSDARWNVPEPELALVLNSRGEVVGYTVGNDMSSRDIEGANLLYLPQAKVYRHSCALGPFIRIAATEAEAREWAIRLAITRADTVVFSGETSVGKIKRTFPELARWLFQSQEFPQGAILLTGTGLVPPNEFTLAAGDHVRIEISGIGVLENTVAVV